MDVPPLQQAINSRAEFLAEKQANLQKAMDAREEFLRAQAEPELQRSWNDAHAISESFGQEGDVELRVALEPPNIIQQKPADIVKPRSMAAPPPSQKPAQATGLLANASKIEIDLQSNQEKCNIHDGNVICVTGRTSGSGDVHFTFRSVFTGRLTVNRMEGKEQATLTSSVPGCTYTGAEEWTEAFDFSAGGSLAFQQGAKTATVTGKSGPGCQVQAMVYPPQKGTGTWKLLP